ncbi:MAG: hypothetical protein ACLQU1_20525 [Bryobacteraceae bacterium]
MKRNAGRTDIQPFLKTIGSPGNPERASAIAGLFQAAQEADGARYEVAAACLKLRQQEQLSLDEIAPYAPAILAFWNAVHARVKPLQQEGPDLEWILEDEYRGPRALAEVLLDLMGYLPAAHVAPSFEEALALADPRLKCFAITSLLRHGHTVDPRQIEAVAASHEMRMIFWIGLRRLGMEWLMPERWSAPEQLAASDLVRWAAHPNELGVPPEEIELMERFLVAGEIHAKDEVYLFRFREYPRPWAPGEGWMAGIAGPIRDGQAQGSPWSSFKPWDSMSPREHFEKLYYRGGCCG